MLYKPEDSPYWYCDIRHKGKRVRRSSNTEDKKAAQEWHDALAHSLWRNEKLGEDLPEPEVAPRTWGEIARQWAVAKSKKGKDRSESDLYRLVWITARWQDLPLEEIDRHTFLELVSELDDDVSDATRTRYRTQVMAILNFAADLEWIKAVPKIPPYNQAPGKTDWLTKEEWERLQLELPPHLLALARFSVATGLRRHNATHLEWKRINMNNRTMWVDAQDMKNGVAHGLPLNDDAMTVLVGQVEVAKKEREKRVLSGELAGPPPRWVFPYRGKPILKTSGKAWVQAKERAHIDPDFTWHGLRHTWASWHRQNGTKLEDLQELGGWKSIQMVQRYAHIGPTQLSAVANNVKPVSLALVSSEPA